MFQRILAPLDGSPRAELILPRLAPLWRQEASELVLLHSVPAHGPANGGYETVPSLVHQREDAEAYLQGVARRCRDAGADVRTRVVQGSPSGAIQDAAGEEGATMIAMTTHGRTGILRWIMGGVATQVLRASRVPVLLVRSSHSTDLSVVGPASPGESPFSRILIATDGSPASMAILEPAMQFAAPFGSDLIAFHARDSYVPDGAPLLGMEAGMLPLPQAPLSPEDEVTAEVARRLAPSGLRVIRATRPGEPAAEILNYCSEHRVDLIALVTHDRLELSRWMTGSVAERVLRSARVPLLVVRAAPKPVSVPP